MPRSQTGRSPNFFILGAPKCGTTSLHSALSRCHEIYMSPVKEPGYFTNDSEFQKGPKHYTATYFRGATHQAIVGEATPWYLYSDSALSRIRNHIEQDPMVARHELRFLILLRDPVARAFSMYRDQVRMGREHRDFDEAVAQEIHDLDAARVDPDVRRRYVWGGGYSPHLARWLDEFGSSQVLALSFRELVNEPTVLCDQLSDFLSLDLGQPFLSGLGTATRNSGGSTRSSFLQSRINRLVNDTGRGKEALKFLVPRHLQRRAFQRLERFNRRKAPVRPMESEATSLLKAHYGPERDLVAKLLGHQRWSGW